MAAKRPDKRKLEKTSAIVATTFALVLSHGCERDRGRGSGACHGRAPVVSASARQTLASLRRKQQSELGRAELSRFVLCARLLGCRSDAR